jgi:hypothetical protein
VYPFSSLMLVTQQEVVLHDHSVPCPTTDAREHGSLRFVAMSLGQGLLSSSPSHTRSSKADCSDTSREPLPTRCRMRLGSSQTVTWTGRPTNTFREDPVIMAVGIAIDIGNRGLFHVVWTAHHLDGCRVCLRHKWERWGFYALWREELVLLP